MSYRRCVIPFVKNEIIFHLVIAQPNGAYKMKIIEASQHGYRPLLLELNVPILFRPIAINKPLSYTRTRTHVISNIGIAISNNKS